MSLCHELCKECQIPVHAGASISDADMRAYCSSQGLAGFKIPRFIRWQASSLPANSSGKVIKQLVKEELLNLQQEAIVACSRL